MKFTPLDEKSWEEVRRELKLSLSADTTGIVARTDEGEFAGALVFDNWTFTSCVCHILVVDPRAFREGLLQEGYEYIFVTCGRKMILGVIASDRDEAMQFIPKLGWELLYTLKDGVDNGVDMNYFRYTKEQWLARKAA